FKEAFRQMGAYPWLGDMLFMGKYIKAMQAPWYYIPVWMGITIPLLYLFFFMCGFIAIVKGLFRGVPFIINRWPDLIFLFCLFAPVVSILILKSVVYAT